MTQDELRKEFEEWFSDIGANMDFWTCYQAAALKRDAEIAALKAELEGAKKDAKDGWDAFHKLRKQVAKGVYGDDLRNEVSAAYHADATGIT